MNPNLNQADAIFQAALEIPDGPARREYLDKACGGDLELRGLVERLLAAVPNLSGFLDQPAYGRPGEEETSLPAGESLFGQSIGPYKLLQKLGEGGMGVVYMAEQSEPFRRRVALKVIRAGMDSAQVIARFEHERQALALMDHPNIARVLDAGVTATGRPYFAMELVHGIPITKYCDQEALALEDRLRLFISVCRAVQHAHQKGIIHRDLKPSNVIVGLYDGQPIPKVIDFGVAKATGQRLIEQTLFTEVGQIVGTIEYMAPEQAETNNLDIDTRADVYSLGVLLYELLTGSPPFAAKTLRRAGLGEMLRIIKEVEPTKPSTKITSADDLPRVAANRRLEPARLARLIRGDLDWITMKCLEKSRTRRYETANGLAQDIERFLADEQVQACPPSTGYRLRKFARKHARMLSALGAIALLLVVGTVVSIRQAVRASRAEKRSTAGWTEAERQRDEALAQRRQTREALDTILDPEGLGWLGAQERLNAAQKAFLQKAVSLYEALAVDTTTDREGRLLVAQANARVGELLVTLGQFPEASTAIARATEQFEQLADEFPDDTEVALRLGKAYSLTGTLLENKSDHAAMEKAARRAVDYFDRLAKRHPEDDVAQESLAYNLRRLGLALRFQLKSAESIDAYRRAVDIQSTMASRRSSAQSELTHVSYLMELGLSLQQAGRQTEARTTLGEATSRAGELAAKKEVTALSPKGLAQVYFQLIMAHNAAGDWAEVEVSSRRLIPLWETRAAEQPSVPLYRLQLAEIHGFLGESLRQQKKWSDAEAAFTRAVELWERLFQENPRGKSGYNLNLNRSSLALVLLMQGKRAQAEAMNQAALAGAEPDLRGALQMQWAYGLALSGATAEAVAAVEQVDPELLRKLSQSDVGGSEYGLASIYALAVAATSEESQTKRLTDAAIAHLQAAVADGWSDAEYLQNDSDWNALRAHPDFEKVLSDLRSKNAKSLDAPTKAP